MNPVVIPWHPEAASAVTEPIAAEDEMQPKEEQEKQQSLEDVHVIRKITEEKRVKKTTDTSFL